MTKHEIDDALETWRKKQSPPMNRPDAIKELVRRALEAEGQLDGLPDPLSDDRHERARQNFVNDLRSFQSTKNK